MCQNAHHHCVVSQVTDASASGRSNRQHNLGLRCMLSVGAGTPHALAPLSHSILSFIEEFPLLRHAHGKASELQRRMQRHSITSVLHFLVERDRGDMGDALPSATAPSSGQAGWEWKADTQKWVASSGKPLFRVVPDDTKPTLRDPVSTTSKSPLEC